MTPLAGKDVAEATSEYTLGALAGQLGKSNPNLSKAEQWEQSDDPRIRLLALQVYSESSSPTADAGLQRLAAQHDENVSRSAASILAARQTAHQ